MSRKGKGAGIKFLRDHVDDPDGLCLIWPLYRLPGGYAYVGYLGELLYAHRVMCEMVNGHPPTSKHHAAHSCGNGQGGCVHPKHLDWKTVTENMLDRRAHGTVRHNLFGHAGILTHDQVAQARALKGIKTQSEIAEMFGVKRACIQYWHSHDKPKVRAAKANVLAGLSLPEFAAAGS